MARPSERRTAVGKTRSCPHCRATILDSAAVCPACRHHLRFENRRGEQQPQAASQVALKVAGQFARDVTAGPGEYHVVVVIRDAGGAELARKVIGVGGLAPGEERKVELSVEIFDPLPRDMTLKVAELHHCAVRIPPGPDAAGAALRFYNDVIGLESDHVPWDRPGEDQRINAGSHAQVHLVPGMGQKALATGDLDLGSPHLAFAVMSIDEAQAELDRLEVPYRVVHGRLGPDSRRLFLADPAGNLIELHQLGTCRCTARARDGIGQARVSGTILFADMRGFTAVAERLSPSDVVPLLNEYFSMLSAITREHGGTVFHMAGDGLMAGFGLPLPADDASGRAVSAARGMISGFGKLAGDWKTRLGIETGIGIGINAGDVIVGDVGAPDRPSYTLIGDAVNVAARLVQRARAGEALFSLSVKQALDPVPQGIVELPPLVLRGRTRPVEIYCLESPTRIDLGTAAA